MSEKKIYTWDEVKKHNNLNDCWIVVHGKVYDVTKWAPKHPGGRTLISGAGRDSTAFMYCYHPNHVINMLPKYCIGEVDHFDNYYNWDSKFYSTLKNRVNTYMKENNMTRDSTFMYFKTLGIFTFWALSYYLAMIRGYPLAAIFLGFFHAHLGISVMHDGIHGSFSEYPRICNAAAFVMDLIGASSIVWRHQHNVGHHPNSNNAEESKVPSSKLNPTSYDPDVVAGFPYVRLNPAQGHKPYMKYQHYYIWFLSGFMAYKWWINDIKYMRNRAYTLIDFHQITFWDMFSLYVCKIFYFSYIAAFPIYNLGLAKGLLTIGIHMFVLSFILVTFFAINHLTEDAVFPNASTPNDSRDWAVLQVITAANFSLGSIPWTLITGNLNYQIEHHLFPGVNGCHLRHISPIVRKTCEEFGVPYFAFPTFWDALASYQAHIKLMGNPKKE